MKLVNMRRVYNFFVALFCLGILLTLSQQAAAKIFCYSKSRTCCCGYGWERETVLCFGEFSCDPNLNRITCEDDSCWDICNGDSADSCDGQCPCPDSCDDCTLDPCPTGTSTTPTSFGFTQKTCGEGDCYQSKNCYCTSPCTPQQQCEPSYSSSDRYVGIAATYTCNNLCNHTSTKNCYYYPCNDCKINCPAVPAPFNTLTSTEGSIDTSRYPVVYTSCNRGGDCRGAGKSGYCYETPNAIPSQISLSVNSPTPGNSTALGFSSSTTSGILGKGANNYANFTATFRDPNGRDDIESISFWFTTGSAPQTPYFINIGDTLGAKAPSNNSWGFMLHREGSNWIPYVPKMESTPMTTDRWVKAQKVVTPLGAAYNIIAPDGSSTMVQLLNLVVSNNAYLSDKVVNFSLRFMSNSIGYQAVASGNYNIYTMVNDVFGFTPRDNYPSITNSNTHWYNNEIRNPRIGPDVPDYARRWFDSGRDWYIDLVEPLITVHQVQVTGDDEIRLSWSITETQGIYGFVGNIYKSTNLEHAQLRITNINGAATSEVYTPDQTVPLESNVIGNLNGVNAFERLSTASSGYATIEPGENEGGSLIFYITVFDRGGNATSGTVSFNLSDWFASRGGLLYSTAGYGLEVRSFTTDPWPTGHILKNSSIGFAYNSIDMSSEMLGSGNSVFSSTLVHPERGSYELNQLPSASDLQLYNTFKTSFDSKRALTPTSYEEHSGNLSGNMCSTDGCGGKIMYREITADTVTVSSGFRCNGKGVFFIDGNLLINPNITNASPQKDSCIFIVKDNLTINPGSSVSTTTTGYDEINAFIVVQGPVTEVTADTNEDGLLIRGGIYNPNSSISIRRKLDLLNRNSFPVFAVSQHPKYGVFSKEVFGNKINLVKTEVGFKPY